MVWLCKSMELRNRYITGKEKKNVGAQCDWYCFDHVNQQLTVILTEQPMFAHGYHCCSNYVCSLPPPTFTEIDKKIQLMFPNATVLEMQKLMKEFFVYFGV